MVRNFDRGLRWLEPASVFALFLIFLGFTWMRWPDPLVDFSRNLYIPWRVSEGALLYDDVLDWYGPMPHLFEALGFRLFGASLRVVVGLNLAVAVLVLVLLRAIFRQLGDRLTTWIVSLVYLTVSCFAHFVPLGNYNFVTPYVSQATYGMAGLLLSVWGLLRHFATSRSRWLLVAGTGVAIAFLNKPEPLFACAGSVGVFWVSTALREKRLRTLVWMSGWLLAGFASVWGAAFAVLGSLGGPAYGWRAANRVLEVAWSPGARETVRTFPIFNANIGFDAVGSNLLSHLASGALALVVSAAIGGAGWAWAKARAAGGSGRLAALAASAIVIGAGLTADWLHLGRVLLLPVVVSALLFVGWAVRCSAVGRPAGRELGLAVVAAPAALMLARMILNVRIFHYGFFMTLLGVLLLVHLLVFEAPRLNPVGGRPNRAVQAAFGSLLLIATVRLAGVSFEQYSPKVYPVGQGADRFLTLPPDQLRNGELLGQMLEAVRAVAPGARTLVAFPETSAVSYHLRLPSPVAAIEFNPVSLGFAGRARVLQDLQGHPPDVVLLYAYDLRSHGARFFGADDRSGRPIIEWIAQNYRRVQSAGTSPLSVSGHAYDLFVRK